MRTTRPTRARRASFNRLKKYLRVGAAKRSVRGANPEPREVHDTLTPSHAGAIVPVRPVPPGSTRPDILRTGDIVRQRLR